MKKLNEIKTGQFFTIDNTPSYPKLRTEYGYIDFRDEIKEECKDLPWNLEVMTDEEVISQLEKYGIDSKEKLDIERNKLL